MTSIEHAGDHKAKANADWKQRYGHQNCHGGPPEPAQPTNTL